MPGMKKQCKRRAPRCRLIRGIASGFLALLLCGCATAPSKPGEISGGLTPEAVMRVADRTRASGDLAEAAGLYEHAAQMDPKNAKPLIELGSVFNQMHAPTQASAAWQAALAIEPKNTTALRGLANAELEMGDPTSAIRNLQMAQQIQPDWRNHNSLGVAYDMTADHKAAQAAYRDGLALAPNNMQLTNNLGLSLALSGDFAQGLPLLEMSAKDPSATPRMRQNLALAYGLSGDDTKAAEIAKLDLDAAGVQENLGYYEFLRLLKDRNAIASTLGAHQVDQLN